MFVELRSQIPRFLISQLVTLGLQNNSEFIFTYNPISIKVAAFKSKFNVEHWISINFLAEFFQIVLCLNHLH